MTDDIALLRRYADNSADDAFAELVRRNVDFVYATAFRQLRNTHRAEEATQTVFIDLARKAKTLCTRSDLNGWLYLATHYAARGMVRQEVRREARERKAAMSDDILSDATASPDWEKLRPVIDVALRDLEETDRSVLLLRFFRDYSFSHVGRAVGITEDAARKRVERALDKLHVALARRGVTSTAAALATAFANQPLVAAPAALAGSATSAALSGAAAGMASAGILGFMSATKLAIGVTSAAAVLTVGFGLRERHVAQEREEAAQAASAQVERVTKESDDLRRQVAGAERDRAEILRLQAEVARLQSELSAKAAPPAKAVSSVAASEQQNMMGHNLRQIAAAREQFTLENNRAPASMAELVGPDKIIKRLNSVAGEDYSALPMSGALQVTTPGGVSAIFTPEDRPPPSPMSQSEPMRQLMEITRRVGPSIARATDAYRLAHGKLPPGGDRNALLPYFEDAKQGADYVEYLEARDNLRRASQPGKSGGERRKRIEVERVVLNALSGFTS